jgi:cell division protein FtsB
MYRMKLVLSLLLTMLLVEQYALWLGNGGITTAWGLYREIGAQRAENVRLQDRNRALEAEVVDLKRGLDAIEERARADLGMIKKNETFFRVIELPVETNRFGP